LSRNGIGQSPFMWYCRCLPKVKTAFASIWGGDEDLLTSYDGCGVFRPPEVDEKWRTKGGWFHIDQNCYSKRGRNAVQGQLNLFPSGEGDGGLVVVPKSTHMVEGALSSADGICAKYPRGDFVRINRNADWWASYRYTAANDHDYRPVKLCLDAGDFAMWDSRCIHCNAPATEMSDEPLAKTTLKRLTAYICMTPARLAASPQDLALQRTFAFQNGWTTNHWPHEFTPNSTKMWAKEYPVGANHVKLTPQQAKLITGKLDLDVYKPLKDTDINLDFM